MVDLQKLTTMDGADDNITEVKQWKTTAQDSNAEGVAMYKKGAWSKEEDETLTRAVEEYGVRNWVTIEKFSSLARPAKNCRLRWLNYLRPNLKKYPLTPEEEKLILDLHSKFGNSWSRIASKLPGRSDNEIKNFWHKRAKKCQKQHLPIYPTTTEERRQSHVMDEPNVDYKYFPSYPNHMLPFTSTGFTTTPKDASSMILSPQTLISELTHKTTPSSNTPMSQNLNFSPYQRSQSSSNAFFIPLKEPPILSSPQCRFKQFLTSQYQFSTSVSGLPCPNESAILPQCSSLEMESPTSPLKLKLSPKDPQQTIAAPEAPLISPLSPLKLRMSSVPLPLKSNLSVPDSLNVPLNSPTPTGQLGSPIEHMTIDANKNSTLKAKPRLFQFDMLETKKVNGSMHEVDSNTNLEIMEELREAQARVKFLKKKLRQKRLSKKMPSTRKVDFLSENPETTKLYGRELGTIDKNSSQMAIKECLSSTSSGTKDSKRSLRIGGDIIIENTLSKLQKMENFENRKHIQESIVSKKVTTYDEASYIENPKSLQRREDSHTHSLGEIFKIKNTINLQELRHSIHLMDHPISPNTMNNLNFESSNNKLCSFQAPTVGKFLNGWSTPESSTPLHDSFFKGDFFGQMSGIEQSLTDELGTKTTLIKPCDESARLDYLQPDKGGYFGQKDTSLMDGNLATSSGVNLLLRQYPTSALQESNYLVSQLMTEHESLGNSIELSFLLNQCPPANLLDSSYVVSKQIRGQESLQGEQFYFQTSRDGNSDETSRLCESIFLLDHYPATNMMDTKYATACGIYQDNLMKTNCASREAWRQEPSQEESLIDDLLVENLCPEAQIVSQDQTVLKAT